MYVVKLKYLHDQNTVQFYTNVKNWSVVKDFLESFMDNVSFQRTG